MPLQEKTFWLDTVQMPLITERPLPEQVDVAVIGAGFTGLSAARSLAKRGANVVVLEAETAGWGASSRNGGMVLPGLKLGTGQLIARYGTEATRQMYAATLASIDTVERIVREEEIGCDFSRSGHLAVASKRKHFEGFKRSAEAIAREFNHTVHIIEQHELDSEVGSTAYFGGMVDEVSAGVNPARYVAGLAGAAVRAGAVIHERTRLLTLQREPKNGAQGWRLQTSRGAFWAQDVLIATSGYTSSATPALQKKVIPIGSFIIVTEVLPAELALEVIPRNRMIYDSKNYLHYYRLTPDRRMLFGGRAAFFPETHSTIQSSAEILRLGMIEVFPQLKELEVQYAWGGTLDFTFDIMPHAGQLDGLHFALGYAGHGVAMATYLGALMADAIAGEKVENPFAGIPFPGAPLGLYNGKPWFLPFAGLWYKFLDVVQ
ncbi:MAG TPA: FAD-binding oxidoreductase [Terriglobales bacterium]|nr:FAD-binding oxidoreductase [Terriglobales bacterium]